MRRASSLPNWSSTESVSSGRRGTRTGWPGDPLRLRGGGRRDSDSSSSGASGASVRPSPRSWREELRSREERSAPRSERMEPGDPRPGPSHVADDDDIVSVSSGRKRGAEIILPLSEEEQDSVAGVGGAKRRKGRPCKDPSHEGQFTMEVAGEGSDQEGRATRSGGGLRAGSRHTGDWCPQPKEAAGSGGTRGGVRL